VRVVREALGEVAPDLALEVLDQPRQDLGHQGALAVRQGCTPFGEQIGDDGDEGLPTLLGTVRSKRDQRAQVDPFF